MKIKTFLKFAIKLFIIFLANQAIAASYSVTLSPNACSTVTGVGTKTWSNPTRAKSLDASFATTTVDDNQISNYLRCNDYGFAIPTGSTITGITATVSRKSSSSITRDYSVQLLKAGTLLSENNAVAGVDYSTTLVSVDYTSTGLWGTTWTAADINDIGFGVSFVAQKVGTSGGTRTISVDVLDLTINYDYTPVPPACDPPSNIPAGVTVSCVCDQFGRTTLNPSTIFGGNYITSTSDSTGILPRIVNQGYLRLTDATGNNAKAITVPSAFPAAGNYISVEFSLFAYNGSGADGVVLTLSDYSIPAVPGAYGGSLGYAQQTNINGFAGGWMGVAFDEYGNYQNPTEGRIGGPGFLPQTVGIRGSGSNKTGYNWLQGNTSALSPTIDNRTSTTPSPNHRYQVVVDARNTALGQTWVNVGRDTTGLGNSYAQSVAPFDIYARANTLGFTQAAVPANWQLSFTGSTGGSTNIHEIGALKICAQSVVPPEGGTADGFSAIDEAYGTTPLAVQNYLTGHIYTKLVGSPFKLNISAISNSQIQTGYVLSGGGSSKSVTVKLVDNSDGVCELNNTLPNYCNAACKAKTAITGGYQTLTFASTDSGQKQSTSFTINTAYSKLIALINDASTTACSTDSFAVRPLALSTPTTTATNTGLTGSPSFRAATDTFNITVSTTTPGYTGSAATPSINTTGINVGAGWTQGTILPNTFPVANSSSSSTGTFTYSEVGSFSFKGYNPATDATSPRGLMDQTWTMTDQGTKQDCIAGSYANTIDLTGNSGNNPNYGKYGCLFGITSNTAVLGRFYPDHFTLISGSVLPACTGLTRNFTYMGQAKLDLTLSIEARNGNNQKTANYSSASPVYPVVNPVWVAENQDNAHQGCDIASRLDAASDGVWTAGTYSYHKANTIFSRPTTIPPANLDASSVTTCSNTKTQAGGPFWNLDLGIKLVDNLASLDVKDMNAGSSGNCVTASNCDSRKIGSTATVFGRLHMFNGYGAIQLPLHVPVQAEYYNGSSWSLNTDDQCTLINPSSFAIGNKTAGSTLVVNTSSIVADPSNVLLGGKTVFKISPTVKGVGSVDLVLNTGLGVTGTTNWCGPWTNGPVASTGIANIPDISFLTSNWCSGNYNKEPSARIKFGSPKASYIYLREKY